MRNPIAVIAYISGYHDRQSSRQIFTDSAGRVAGLLATRFGGKRVLGCSVLAWSLFTLLTPLAATSSIGALIATRISLGVGEAGLLPAAYELYGRWVPSTERARAVARLLSGVPLGTVIGLIGSGWLVQHYGWPLAFYAFGAVGLLWVPLWFHQVANDPDADPRLDPAERALLPAARPSASRSERVPVGRLLLHAPVLAIVIGQFASL